MKTFAILALAAAYLPATLGLCTLQLKFLEDGKWHSVTKTAYPGDTLYIMGHSTKIGPLCAPAKTTWTDAKIVSWSG
ncbi:uncharacterized protein LY79DRAFT_560064 [Colletotrichum navitas]|uniref:MAX effector domain-containing protein n=1 Tax=Colletotrichum navitas TaxID=681940 RepID=A0AAD8PVI9_9PEZI|nr:uncharacterized protein LY79DRAFT_560064 [Colletotrichum navitas]KAK1584998.1 hypothetical protein LY79DRAFT_560064 [Colletotrichum navitas]